MNIEELRHLSDDILDELTDVWEQAVRSSHHFLAEEDIAFFRPLVRNEYLGAVMLFVRPGEQGQGYGKAFVNFATRVYHIDKVDVNEQNPQALGFYRRMGYRVTGPDALDTTGKPFPILHLQRG